MSCEWFPQPLGSHLSGFLEDQWSMKHPLYHYHICNKDTTFTNQNIIKTFVFGERQDKIMLIQPFDLKPLQK